MVAFERASPMEFACQLWLWFKSYGKGLSVFAIVLVSYQTLLKVYCSELNRQTDIHSRVSHKLDLLSQ